MLPLLSRPLFTLRNDTYTWQDAILSALVGGRWDAVERRVREGLACVRYFERAGAKAPEASIEAAAAEFRYERDLISADEAEAWLAALGLDSADWLGWVRREVLREHCADQLEELLGRYPVTPAEVAEAAEVDLLCSELGGELTYALAERLAAGAAIGEVAAQTGEGVIGELLEERDVAPLVARIPSLDASRAAEQLPLLERIERDHARFAAGAARPEAVRRELEHGRLEWIRLRCEAVHFTTEEHAREAALCVREDGLSLADVAADAHAAVEELDCFLGTLDSELQPRLLSAVPPELVGPLRLGERHSLFMVLEKALPEVTDPDVLREAEARVVARALADQVNRRIRWHQA
jgi:hypothetical protein